ncbi:MAG: B-box zinc finger protein [Tunicatimonas sp.]|uniref:B-box zinc finger protein n=1 Tax=Tunicatimonas sp. TaxID=1940096 RepID=UPI003C79376A
MHCRNHPHQPAVAFCQDCHAGLCVTCSSEYTEAVCHRCNERRYDVTTNSIRLQIDAVNQVLYLYLLILGVSAYLLNSQEARALLQNGQHEIEYFLRYLYLACGAFAGIRFLRNWLKNHYIISAPLTFYVVIFVFSGLVGCIIFPFQLIGQAYKRYTLGKELRHYNRTRVAEKAFH